LRFERTSVVHMVKFPYSSRATYGPLPRTMPRWLPHISKDGDAATSPGKPVPVPGHPHSEKLFPDIQREPPVFQFMPIASDPVTGNH